MLNYSLINDFVSLFFPRYCLACATSLVKGEELVCTSCWSQLPRTNYHLESENELKIRFYGKVELQQAISFTRFSKSGKVQKLLHKLKYEDKPEVGFLLGKQYGKELKNACSPTFDVIVPVPLHRSKLKIRGYNQSAAFGEGLAEALGIPMLANALERTKKTSTQTRKSRLERWQNVENIFALKQHSQLSGKHVLLVDDVVTTGATLEACALALSTITRKISVATIAVA